jgi:hypothetical protein
MVSKPATEGPDMTNHLLRAMMLVAAIHLPGCKTPNDPDAGSAVKNDEQLKDEQIPQRGPKQLKTLDYVFFGNNPRPQPASQKEEADLRAALNAMDNNSIEEKLLRKVFHERYDIMALAARDTDGDGIKDYRVSQYFGKFFEGDLDLDGDGIRNILDADPYDPAVGGRDADGDGQPDSGYADANGNTIPDHVDFGLLYPESKFPFGKRLSEIQVELYKSHKIILVERNQPFTIAAAEVVYDAIKRVFRAEFGRSKVLPTLRSIATEDQVMLIPEEGGETHALVSTPTQAMIIYRSGLAVPDIVLLGLLTHELGHSIQYSPDYNPADAVIENNRIYFPNPKYFRSMEPFGWQTDNSPISGLQNFQLWVPAYEYIRPNWTWNGKSPDVWFKYVDDVYAEVGESYMQSRKIAGKNIVSQYSLTDPFEWLSDNQIAYLFSQIESEVLRNLGGDAAKKKRFQKNLLTTIEAAWPGFAHFNFKDKSVQAHLASRMPLLASDLKLLAERYGNPIVVKPQIVTGMSLTGESAGAAVRCRPAPIVMP